MANSPSQTPFTYQPLPSGYIRLFKFSMNQGGRICELSDVYLARAPKYYTLSYTWDDQERDQDLLVNGAILKVIKNIPIIFHYLFERYQSQYFWIDGICINQNDDKEKELQIPLMGRIYSQAIACVIWLGENDEKAEKAIPMIPSLMEKFEGYDFSLGFNNQLLAARGLPPISDPVWEGLLELYSRGWFTRVWTFQEAVLPKTLEIICGRYLIDSTSLWRCASIAQSISSTSIDSITGPLNERISRAQVGIQKILTIAFSRNEQNPQTRKGYTFLDLLGSTVGWESSKKQDRIYGLLGLADQPLRDQLPVKYEIGINDLLIKLVECMIPRDLNLKILSMVVSPSQPLGLPSWCPHFSYPIALPLEPYAQAARYRAGIKFGRNSPAMKFVSKKEIRVEGFRVDEIAKVLGCPWNRQNYRTPESKRKGVTEFIEWEIQCLEIARSVYSGGSGPSHRGGFRSQLLKATRDVLENVLTGLPYDAPDDEVPDAYWRTLIANRHANGQYYIGLGKDAYRLAKVGGRRLGAEELGIEEFPMSAKERLLSLKTPTQSQIHRGKDYSDAMGNACCGRSFFSTRGGRIGIGPLHTKPGDLVCIFYNGYLPFIIRLITGNGTEKSYNFIGESYVDGLMYGEAFKHVYDYPERFFSLK
jgi:Heterokaryon incompatibility protein (HET)